MIGIEATIRMGHGAGGRMMADLIQEVFLRHLDNPHLRQMADATVLALSGSERVALSTDSFVVRPLFFPGGDIGSLAVHGTVNDLAMRGARPLWITAAFILEEGLPLEHLQRIVQSMAAAARRAGVVVVAGDTKVVERGHGDGVYINTTGIGVVPEGVDMGPHRLRPGDVVLISGTVGDHGIAVLSEREGLGFETELVSDSAPLNSLVEALLTAAPHTHCLRDPTRGGVAAALNELATAAGVGVEIEEAAIPIHPAVAAACEMLGLDPLTIASEGKLVAFVPPEEAEGALAALQAHPLGQHAARIGVVTHEHPGRVLARTGIGGRRVVDMPLGELLPRIC
ncbi:MAG: hydrogenase expression/formation protein HypE [Anaerolineae bacterium]|nr:hydrogenase expression/formation protein HypE [Anaerolineae bacterium]MDW8068317.1 hydrogenase expression/formation protein HypE [Anaerolineae bacterium]